MSECITSKSGMCTHTSIPYILGGIIYGTWYSTCIY